MLHVIAGRRFPVSTYTMDKSFPGYKPSMSLHVKEADRHFVAPLTRGQVCPSADDEWFPSCKRLTRTHGLC